MTVMLVTEITRVTGSKVCVAGVEKETRRRIRPIARSDDLFIPAVHLDEHGGLFKVGAVLDLGRTSPEGVIKPHVEDELIQLSEAQLLRELSPAELAGVLEEVATDELKMAFGHPLELGGEDSYTAAMVPIGYGDSSLACWRVSRTACPTLEMQWGYPYVTFLRGGDKFKVKLNATEYYEPDLRTPDNRRLEDLKKLFKRGLEGYFLLGLTREYEPSGNKRGKGHWMQLNGIVSTA